MSQQYNSRTTRRARARRNRPELVPSITSTDDVRNALEEAETIQPSDESTATAVATPVTTRTKKLANFFSTVGRSEKTTEAQETDVAQARLARATRGKALVSTEDGQTSTDKEPMKVSTPARTAPTRPPTLFKTKYLIGMAAYLFGAQFIGGIEMNFLRSIGLDDPKHPLFSVGPYPVGTSTLAFLATLLVLLLVLARFDLIPRSFGALSGQQSPQNKRNTSNSDRTLDGPKSPPPTMKQGIKGDDDDLYQEYRSNQRRTRKR